MKNIRLVVLAVLCLASIIWAPAAHSQDFVRQQIGTTQYTQPVFQLRLSALSFNPPMLYDIGTSSTTKVIWQAVPPTNANTVSYAVTAPAAAITITQPDPGANATAMLAVSAVSCGATVTCSATATPGLKIAFGSAPLTSATPSTAVVTAIPAFTSTTSFTCVATEQTTQANNTLKVVNTSTTSITITGAATNTDTIGYFCWGT
ncbi:MAG TPA: hypothetical protein VGJ33_16200 [Candidatus Angelobacter sp.]|jgi:hypothetical protein